MKSIKYAMFALLIMIFASLCAGLTEDKKAFFEAVESRDLETIKILVEKGVNVDVKNEKDETPLHLSLRLVIFGKKEYSKSLDIIRYLLANNAKFTPGDQGVVIDGKIYRSPS